MSAITRAELHAAMRTEVLRRFPGLDALTDDEIGAAFAAIPALDAGNPDAVKHAVAHQRQCAAYLASMERGIKAEQRRLDGLFQ